MDDSNFHSQHLYWRLLDENSMALISEIRIERTNPSRLISELREKRRLIFGNLDTRTKDECRVFVECAGSQVLDCGAESSGFY